MDNSNLNYYKIGQRIRKLRKAYDYSQEELAEKTDISTTHLSHIETGNTKLSLTVLVRLAKALNVRVDELLFEFDKTDTDYTKEEIYELLGSCDPQELHIIKDTIKALKASMSKYRK